MKKYKQVIVMRADLNMRKGKMVAQGAHVSLRAVRDTDGMSAEMKGDLKCWEDADEPKIVVSVKSKGELLAIYDSAKNAGMLCSIVEDLGHTEFHGVPTFTACAVGPADEIEVNKITGGLKLL